MTPHVLVVVLLSAACTDRVPDVEVEADVDGEPAAVSSQPIAPRRSLVATEQTVLARFTLVRVFDQLVAQSGVPGLTSLALFQQWWDTQNPGPGLGAGPHCDDVLDQGEPAIGGYPYSCRPEGAQARVDPFVDPGTNPNELVPIALVNRFDLTPGDASNCGEYRIVYARRAGITNARDRNLVIVEAILANPHPQQKLKGCRKIVEFWADLSAVTDPIERADRLEAFFFDGIPSVAPVIRIEHLGAGPTGRGQVRTNQFMASQTPGVPWSLREFKLQRTCTGANCTALRLVPVQLKNNPWGGLFRSDSTHPQAAAFQAAFVDQVQALAAQTIADLDLDLPLEFNTAQAQASASGENNYLVQFGTEPNPFRAAIATRLVALGSTLTPDDIVARAQALSCAGCHRLNNNLAIGAGLIFPSALGFVHVSERDTEIVDGEVRFVLSDALANEFLPKREQVMRDYLDDKLKKPKKDTDPIGGKRVH
ncbi:MAG: hypothetical protein H0T46_10685 [Deltaproteobacteria bacterium]|nr:hypothetical protein [Deltaproteobacteria bacterium]